MPAPGPESQFVLNGTMLLAVLTGAGGIIGFLFRLVVSGKDAQITEMTRDRDYWREVAISLMGPAERAVGLAEKVLPLAADRSKR